MRIVDVEPAPLATVRVTQSASPTAIGTMALPVRDTMSVATASSLLQSDWRWLGGGTIQRVIVQGSVLTLQRNECVQRMAGEWLLFIDDDMAFDDSAIADLVGAYLEMVREFPGTPIIMGGLCVRRQPPHQPTLYMRQAPDAGHYAFLEKWKPGATVEVDATGMAFVVIGKEVFEAVMGGPMPSPEDRMLLPPWPFFEWTAYMGEDIHFCQKAKAAGADEFFVDTGIEIGHVGETVFKLEHFYQQVATRELPIERARRKMNASLGLPTLSAKEARERLGW